VLSTLQYRALLALYPGSSGRAGETAYANKSKLATLLGPDIWTRIAGKHIIDFGCGEGTDAVEMAKRGGAARVAGIDIREDALDHARRKALAAGVHNCSFETTTTEPADILISVDAFEHFADPAVILQTMAELLKPGGEVLISFGPTWYHPRGGHLFSVFPWAHILLTELALIRWRSTFKADGATRFHEVAGGLNQMTIRRFEQLVAASPFRFESFQCVPIRPLRRLHNRLTREWTTSIVRCRLVRRSTNDIQYAMNTVATGCG
jgi:SAM-dependent methyltransferase